MTRASCPEPQSEVAATVAVTPPAPFAAMRGSNAAARATVAPATTPRVQFRAIGRTSE
ncbi:hypothetical protein GCM10028777_35040 [Angustibacter speluncae]